MIKQSAGRLLDAREVYTSYLDGKKIIVKRNGVFYIAKVIRVLQGSTHPFILDYECELNGKPCDFETDWKVDNDTYEYLETEIKPKTFMQKLNIYAKRFLDSNTKKLIEAGFLNTELELTTAGQSELWSVILTEHLTKLVTAAEEKIAEEQKEKCK